MVDSEILKNEIKASFKMLGYESRGNQEQIVYDVLDLFLNKNKRNVVLGAPTGAGKSLIGAVISDCINKLTERESGVLPSIIAMGTNSLAKQYSDSFSHLDKSEYFQIRGAGTYSCAYMEAQPSAVSKTADECVVKKLHETEVEKYCKKCEFNIAKKIINATDNLVTNYTYFMISALASGHLKPRNLHIFDEAHTLNSWFCSYSEIVVSIDLLDRYIKELGDVNGKCDNEIAALIMLKDKITIKEVGENNYKQYLEVLKSIYTSVASTLGAQSTLLTKVDVLKSSKYDKMARKYISLASKITDLFDNDYDHVFDAAVPNTFTVKTIFISHMIEKLLTEYNLFMSGTITESYVYDILELDKEKTAIIQLPPVFPKENKPIFFIGKQSLNYQVMKDPETISTLKDQIKKIVTFHKDQKGLILVPSFYLGSQLAYNMKYTKVFEHKQGTNISELISDFKDYKGSSVFVSPSIFEGLSFDDDLSRFQIIVKSPFESLGDKRVKYIADNYPKIYQEMTLLKIVQGAGRAVRSPEDYAATYCLDQSTQRIFEDKSNIWKSHFKIMSK